MTEKYLTLANRATTTLSAGIDNAVTTIPVVSTALFAAEGAISVEDEIIKYDSKDATNFLECTRAYDGTSAAAHDTGLDVRGNIIAAHHNLLRDAIVAVEAALPALGDHATHTHLDYASAGHTGFEPAKGVDDNFVTAAQLVVLGNTSGVNTGDKTLLESLDTLDLSSVGSLALHLRADLGITKDGSDLVSVWEDQGPLGLDFVQATAGLQPTWQGAQINGQDVVYFDGTRWMKNEGFDAIVGGNTKPFTFFIVARKSNWGTSGTFLNAYYHDGSNANTVVFLNNGTAQLSGTYQTIGTNTYYSGGMALESFGLGRTYLQYTAFTAEGCIRISNRVDGVPMATNRIWYSSATQPVKYACLGAQNASNLYSTISAYLAGYIAEIIIFNESLPLPMIQLVEQYLARRYMLGGTVVAYNRKEPDIRWVHSTSSNYTVLDFESEVRCTGANTTVTLPSIGVAFSTKQVHRVITITRVTASAGVTTIHSGNAINGVTADIYLKENNQSVTLACDTSVWEIIGSSPENAYTLGLLTNLLTEKTTPVDADMVPIMDSAASNLWKKLSWANIKATLKAYFDTIYTALISGVFETTVNYTGSAASAKILSVLGTAADPDGTQDAVGIFQKISDDTTVSGVNPSLYTSIKKKSSGNLQRATALFAEGQDDAGGSGSFIEGVRGQAVIMANAGSAYGAVFVAGTDTNKTFDYLTAVEGESWNNSGSDAPASFDKTKFSAAFVGSSKGTQTSDVGFVTNPYNNTKFREGFLVAEDSVSEAAFRSRAATAYGIDLLGGSQSQAFLRAPNNTVMRIRNGANTASLNILYVDASDQLILGTDCSVTMLINPLLYSVPVYANNAAAVAGGLGVGETYRTGGDPDQLCIVH